MADITYEIVEHIATLSTGKTGWTKEVNLVSWNGGEAKVDIREWSPDHSRMGKGVTMTMDELDMLVDAFSNRA